MSAWAWLLGAGIAEVAWSQSIRPTEGFSRPLPTLLCFLLAAAAVYPLSRAMEAIPVGTAYVVFTGIGAGGAVLLGVGISGDPLTASRLFGIGLVLAGALVLQSGS
jgi:quaternary ammonium compound-resistance protein SugE